MDAMDILYAAYNDDYLPCGIELEEFFGSESIKELQSLMDEWLKRQNQTYFEAGSLLDRNKYVLDVENFEGVEE